MKLTKVPAMLWQCKAVSLSLRQKDGKSFKFLITLRQCVCNIIVSGEPPATLQLAVMSFARSSLLAAMFCQVINLFAAIFFFAVSLH